MLTKDTLLETTKLDEAIQRLLIEMSAVDCISDEYAKMADQLGKLYKMKEIDSNVKLKAFDAIGKRKDQKKNVELKRNELDSRRQEIDNNTDLKERELVLKEKDLELKQEDLEVKRTEVLANCELKATEAYQKKRQTDLLHRVSLDTWAIIGGNLLGIVLIIGYERANVLTSKAFSFVTRLR